MVKRLVTFSLVLLAFTGSLAFAASTSSYVQSAEINRHTMAGGDQSLSERFKSWIEGLMPKTIPIVGSPLQRPFDGDFEQGQSFGNKLGTYNGFEYNGFHPGEDWSIGKSPVLAVADGIVLRVVRVHPNRNLGSLIILKHDNPELFYSGYTHVAPEKIKQGDSIKRGQVIAFLDLNVAPPHLHWEIKKPWNERTPWWDGSNALGYYTAKEMLSAKGFVNPSDFVASYQGMKGIPKRVESFTIKTVGEMITQTVDAMIKGVIDFLTKLVAMTGK